MAPRDAFAESDPDLEPLASEGRAKSKRRKPRLVLAERVELGMRASEAGGEASEETAGDADASVEADSEPEIDSDPRKPKRRAARPKAKKAPSKRVATSSSRARAPLSRELTGVALFGVGLLCLFALASYTPSDPGFGVRGSGEVHNWIGPVGAYLADGLTLLLGLSAYGVPVLCFVAGLVCFRPTLRLPRWTQLAGAGLALLGSVVLLDVILGRASFLPYPAGGLIGAIVAGHLVPWLFGLGTGTLALIVAVVGGALVANHPPGALVHAGIDLGRKGLRYAEEQLEVWREKQRLLTEERERIEALLAEEAERARALEEEEAERRKARVSERAEKLAKREVASERSEKAEPEEDDVAPSDDESAPPRILGEDPRWVLGNDTEPGAPAGLGLDQTFDEPIVDGKLLRLSSPPSPPAKVAPVAPVAPRKAAKEAKHEAPPETPSDDDGDLVIVERQEDDAQKKLEEAEKEVEQEARTFELPPLKLLDYDAPDRDPVDADKLHAEAQKLVQKFKDFGIDGRVREVRPGPVCTTFEFVPAPGIKVSRIAALADDIAMAMEAIHVRIVAPIPGKGAVGIEIPNEKRETVYLKEVIADASFRKKEHKLVMALGKDIEGRPYSANLADMPHVLISGTTGSGKSVSVNAMICSILYRATPDDVKFLMIDPKMLELSIYDGIPHLLLPPIVDSKKAAVALKWAVDEMERRYQAMSDLGVRDIEGFNARLEKAKGGDDEGRPIPKKLDGTPYTRLPYIVVVVDEYADLLAVAGKDVEGYVMRLAQKARAAGIHVMLATQRPSVDVITGVIKANFPVRMGFRLASSHDSKTIVNRPGAEKLLGRGDMLIMPAGTSNLTRVHGAFISEKELHRVVEFLKEQRKPEYNLDILKPSDDEDGEGGEFSDEKDEKYDDAVRVVAKSRKCSTSWLQRQLGIGYNRAARIVEMMERQGLVGPTMNAKGDREIYVQPSGD